MRSYNSSISSSGYTKVGAYTCIMIISIGLTVIRTEIILLEIIL